MHAGERRWPQRAAAACAVALFVVLGSAHALTITPLFPHDEGAHLAYAAALADGVLPQITTTVTVPGLPEFSDRIVSVANHPPLYYLLAAAVFRVANAVGDAETGVYVLRLVNVALGAVGVVLTGRLARWLAPGRPLVEATAMGVFALTPMAVHISALLHNDALGIVVSVAGLLAAANVLASGASWPSVLALAAAVTAAALTRASGLALGIALVAVPLGAFTRRGTTQRRTIRLVASSAAAALVVAAGAGWFYLRNLLLYGDLTGATALLERYERVPGPSPLQALASPAFWLNQLRQVWGRLAGGYYDAGGIRVVASGVSLLICVVAVVALVRRLRGEGHPDRWPSRVLWLIVAAYGVAVGATLLWFVAGGGSPHARYLLPFWPALAVAVGVALCGTSPRWRVPAITAFAVGAAAVNLGVWHNLATAPKGGNVWLVRAGSAPDATVIVLVVIATGVLVLGYLLAVAALARQARPLAVSEEPAPAVG